MKIGVVSDTHGHIGHVVEKLKELDLEYIIHLGDHSEDGIRIQDQLKKQVIVVRGNCDFCDIKNPSERIIEIDGRKIFITHGHKYGIKRDIRNLYYRGKELGVDIVLFGHTHIPYIFQEDNINIFNPGSASFSRNETGESVGIITLSDGEVVFEIMDL